MLCVITPLLPLLLLLLLSLPKNFSFTTRNTWRLSSGPSDGAVLQAWITVSGRYWARLDEDNNSDAYDLLGMSVAVRLL